jgi:hypothetical protein
MANHDCQISDLEAQLITPPSDDPDFLTPGYAAPTGKLLPWLSIKIYYSATEYFEFNHFYVAGSAQGEGVYGSRGFAGFTIKDDNRTAFALPFMPCRFLTVVISDELGDIFTGVIENVLPEIFGLRIDGTPLQFLRIECQDLWSLLEQDAYNEVYVNKKTGYILRDAFSRAGLDVSEIDPDIGTIWTRYPVRWQHPGDVVTPLLGLLDQTYWIDGPTRKVWLFDRDSSQTEVLRVDESNWHTLFDRDLELVPDQTGFANKLILTHQLKWNAGTANFEQGTDVVLGYSGDEQWSRLQRTDLSIENTLTGAVYRINKNNSDSEGANELILETSYKESTDDDAGTNVPYLIRGASSVVVERNHASIERLKAFQGGNGVVAKVVSLDNVPLFTEEARRVAKAELAIASRDHYHGSARSDGHRLRELTTSAPQPGRTIYFDLVKTRGIQARVRIEAWSWQDISTRNDRDDGTRVQGLRYEFEFTPSVSREQIREITKQLARSGVSSDDATILDVEFIANTVVFKDCVTVVEPITMADQSIFEAEDSFAHREVETKTWYFAPATTHPDSEAFFTGFTYFSNFS